MTFGLTPNGFNAMRLADVKQALENAFVAQFGDINLDPQSVFGQEIGVLSKSFADLWENLEDVYFSQYPNSASGVSLDNVAGIIGITRIPAIQTSVIASCFGLEGTLVPINSIASIPVSGQNFYANNGGVITAGNAVQTKIQVQSVTTQAYTVVLDNQAFTYSFPIITFSNTGDIFQTGCSIVATINGITQTAIPFTTDSNTTLGLLATQIQNFNGGLSCTATPTNPNIITIVPNVGYQIVINSIFVSGGASNPTYVTTYAAPGSFNLITAGLTAIINAGTPSWLSTDNMDQTFTINANSPSLPFSASVGVNLSIVTLASPIQFLCVDFGPIPCPIGALTNIVTPIAGWSSITNAVAGTLGSFTETDSQLRARIKKSFALLGNATVPAITAELLTVPGVTSAVVYENTSLVQTSLIISFPAQFVGGDVVSITYEPSTTMTVNYAGSQNATMAALVTFFETFAQVSSATYGGAGNQTLTVNFNIFQELIVTAVTTDVSSQTAALSGGLPPKSFEAVVQGGSQDAIANKIWQTKPAGIETFGNVNNFDGIVIVDSQGNDQTIFFSTPTQVYIWVEVALTLNPQETFPVNGASEVQLAIFNYINSLSVGQTVLFQKVQAQIFTVPGVASGNMQIALTNLLTQSPSYSTSDLILAKTQVPITELSLITVTVV